MINICEIVSQPANDDLLLQRIGAKPNLPPLLPLILTPVKALATRQLGICVFLSHLTLRIYDIQSVLYQCSPSRPSFNVIMLKITSFPCGSLAMNIEQHFERSEN